MRETFRPAQLASAAARVSANGASSVLFELTVSAGLDVSLENGAVPGSEFRDSVLIPLPGDSEMMPAGKDERAQRAIAAALAREELLYYSNMGVDLRIRTKGDAQGRPLGVSVQAQRDAPEDGFAQFSGHAALNPGFLYDFSQYLEVLVEFDPDVRRPRTEHAQVATQVAHGMAALAVDCAAAPILFMHFPAAPYRGASPDDRQSVAQEAIRPTQSMCIRMSVAVLSNQTSQRLDLLIGLRQLAKDWGLRLSVGDGRPGRVRGEWLSVREFSPRRYRRQVGDVLGVRKGSRLSSATVVTIIGPARVGSTRALLEVLAENHVGVAGLCISSLQEVAFLNALVVNQAGGGGPAPIGVYDFVDGIERVVKHASGRDVSIPLGSDAAQDYKVLIAGSYPLSVDKAGEEPRPIWLTWDMPIGAGELTGVVDSAVRGCTEQGVSCVVQYARARVVGNGRVRGRAKLSAVVPVGQLHGLDIRERLTQICDLVVARVRLEVGYSTDSQVRATWRERWLGGRDAPL